VCGCGVCVCVVCVCGVCVWCGVVCVCVCVCGVCVALVIQHAIRMRRILLSYVACPAVQNFSTLSHKRYDSRKNKKVVEHKNLCFDFL